ncbi:hypothetical protein EV182_004061, partial [Spiromyces aspiralis]
IPFDYEEVDIRAPGNEKWFDEYKYDIPAVHVNGEFLLYHRVDEERTKHQLRSILKRLDAKQKKTGM